MSVYYKKELNPRYWKGDKFDPEVREKLLKIARDLYEPLEINPDDITLTGSLAGFAYTKHSDLDVHILVDFKSINKDIELVKDALDGKRFAWNMKHDIRIKGHEVELYFQDSNEPHHSLAVYSLLRDEWIKKPKYDPPTIDWDAVNYKANAFSNLILKMEKLIQDGLTSEEYGEINEKAKKLQKKIQNFRREGLQKDGEFSVENLVFKKLRHTDMLQTLIRVMNVSYDKIYSDQNVFESFHSELQKYLK